MALLVLANPCWDRRKGGFAPPIVHALAVPAKPKKESGIIDYLKRGTNIGIAGVNMYRGKGGTT